MNRTARLAREAVLWAGGALGALCLASFLAGWLFSITPLVFVTGSMSPTYDAGALGIAREVPATELAAGDVVSVVNADGQRVTHRVVSATEEGNAVALTLQGDTNNVPDAETYHVTSADRLVLGVPYAGRVLAAATTPIGLLMMGLLVTGSLLLGFRRDKGVPPEPSPRRRALVPAGLLSVVALGGVAGASGLAPWAVTSAVWTDSATATATMSTVAPAVVFNGAVSCSASNPNITISWTNVDAGYEYFWQVQELNGLPTVGEPSPASGTVGAAVPQGGTVSVSITPGGNGNRAWQVAVYAQLEGQPATRSSPVLRPIWRIQPGGNRMSCTAT
ncbi:signal peptidase [Nocardioides sp. J9]|uniref:signal peptidase I n=1 Tax=Nocardioides sp. J9 TaxID=935844 RepID=UPI0011A8AFA4|nr:signal peptidase I [Nocardioides sp. J9]TWG97265.1 signal peptidase [Nocardioides sp. J9]